MALVTSDFGATGLAHRLGSDWSSAVVVRVAGVQASSHQTTAVVPRSWYAGVSHHAGKPQVGVMSDIAQDFARIRGGLRLSLREPRVEDQREPLERGYNDLPWLCVA